MILSRTNNLVKKVTIHLEYYRVHEATRLLRSFIVEDVSHWYIRLIRPRAWVEENTPNKLAAHTTLHYVLTHWLLMMAPFIPFLTEKIYQEYIRMTDQAYQPRYTYLIGKVEEKWINDGLEEEMNLIRRIYEATAARMKAGIKLRQPARSITIYTDKPEVKRVVEKYNDLLKRLINTAIVESQPLVELGKLVKYRVEPIYRVLGSVFRKLIMKIIECIGKHQDEIARDISSTGEHHFTIENVEVILTRERNSITPTYIEGCSVEDREWGSIAIDVRLTEELSLGLAKDLIRRIQVMRKEPNLELDAKIKTIIIAPEKNIGLIEKQREYIMNETRSVELIITSKKPEKLEGYVKEWEIMGEKYIVAITPAKQ